jgi:hypothetical protein
VNRVITFTDVYHVIFVDVFVGRRWTGGEATEIHGKMTIRRRGHFLPRDGIRAAK